MTTVLEPQKEIIVAPFGMEADHPRNSDILLQCVPNARLRSAIDGAKGAVDVKTQEVVIPVGQVSFLSGLPKVPGMQIHVNPAELTYVIKDPLEDDEALCDRLTRWLRTNAAYRSTSQIKGVPVLKGRLDVHRIKTLCRELFNIVQMGEGKWIRGAHPTMDEIETLPGHFLLNPGLRTATTQPVYEKDFEGWVDRLSHSGG